jgi:hypothetical protein
LRRYVAAFSDSSFAQLEARLKKFYTDVIKCQSAVRAHFAWKLVSRLRARARMDADARAKDAAEQANKLRAKYTHGTHHHAG